MSTQKLSLEEKVKIVQEAEQVGFTETALKHNISARQIYRWRDKLQNGGSKALSYGAKIDPELKALKEENLQLKKLVAKLGGCVKTKIISLRIARMIFISDTCPSKKVLRRSFYTASCISRRD